MPVGASHGRPHYCPSLKPRLPLLNPSSRLCPSTEPPHVHAVSPSCSSQAFFDATGRHWQAGTLVGKPATLFASVATQARLNGQGKGLGLM